MVFHDFHHPFWGPTTPIFGNTRMILDMDEFLHVVLHIHIKNHIKDFKCIILDMDEFLHVVDYTYIKIFK